MVLDFPMRSDYALMDVDQHHFFMTHGHLFNEDQLPLLNENDTGIVLNGIYGRDTSNIYAKPVVNGKSEYALSKEEEQAINQVIKNK